MNTLVSQLPESGDSPSVDCESTAVRGVPILNLWFRAKLWKRVLLALLVGIVWGILSPDSAVQLRPIGDLFLRLIQMLVAPLILATLVSGVVAMGDVTRIGSIGIRTIGFFLVTTILAVMIGIIAGMLFTPGAGLELPASVGEQPVTGQGSFVEQLVTMVPANPFQALAAGHVFQIMVFALMFGAAILSAGKEGEPLARFFSSLAEVMLKVTGIVMELAPFGVAALIAVSVGIHGPQVLGSLCKLIAVYYLACAVHMCLVFGGILRLLLNLRPARFFRGMMDAMAVAFSSASSAASLPITFTCVQDNLGVSRSVASLVLSLGATLNSNGSSLYMALVAIFTAQAAHVTLSPGDLLTIALISTLASVGTAAIPGGSLVILSTVLLAVDLPLSVFALVAGIDRVMDMARTTLNVTGDGLACIYVAKATGEFDCDTYNSVAVK